MKQSVLVIALEHRVLLECNRQNCAMDGACSCYLIPPERWGMAEDHGTPEVEQLPGPGPEVVERQSIANKRAAQRVCSWTVQNEM